MAGVYEVLPTPLAAGAQAAMIISRPLKYYEKKSVLPLPHYSRSTRKTPNGAQGKYITLGAERTKLTSSVDEKSRNMSREQSAPPAAAAGTLQRGGAALGHDAEHAGPGRRQPGAAVRARSGHHVHQHVRVATGWGRRSVAH